MSKVRLVGVAGGSGSGKTTLCNRVAETVAGVSVLNVDAYYLDHGHLGPAVRRVVNYDEPAAFDLPLLVEHVSRLARREEIAKPRYSFEKHARVGFEAFSPDRLVLIEGLFTLWWEELRMACDLTVFVEAAADVRLLRRIRRDVADRGRTIESVAEQYLGTVRPMHERFVAPTRRCANVVIVNDDRVETALASLCEVLRRADSGLGAVAAPTPRWSS